MTESLTFSLAGRLAAVDGSVLDRGQLAQAIATAARTLEPLVDAGDVVALVSDNGPLAATSLLATMAVAGAAPANPNLPAAEATRFLAAAGASVVAVEAGAHNQWRLAAAAAGLPLLELVEAGRPAGSSSPASGCRGGGRPRPWVAIAMSCA